ncbi:HD-GYP domain-containing protein [Kaarinaea lacus]
MMKIMMEIKDLKKGMYVSELDRPWLETPFLFQGFRITNVNEIEQLGDTCKFVYVDPEKSVVPIPPKTTVGSLPNRHQSTSATLKRPGFVVPYKNKFEVEFPKAKEIYKQATDKVSQLFADVRTGKSVNVQEIKNTVTKVADSVIRNPDALMLLSTLKNKDEQSVTHSVNVCALSLIFGRYVGLDKKQLYELGSGALLHDIGETDVPNDILYKDERTDEENKIMQSHTARAVDVLKNVRGLPASVIEIARDHHERENGSGYPLKLQGSQLGLYTKMVAIVDVYDNVTSGMYGKPAISCTEALKNMYVWRDELFDGVLVERFIQCLGIYPVGSVVELSTGEIGIVISINPERRLLPRIMLVRDEDKQPYEPPKIINLESFCKQESNGKIEIRRVVKPDVFSIDVRNYILRELNLQTA